MIDTLKHSSGGAPRVLVLRLRFVAFLDASGGAALLQVIDEAMAEGARVILAGLQPQPAAELAALRPGFPGNIEIAVDYRAALAAAAPAPALTRGGFARQWLGARLLPVLGPCSLEETTILAKAIDAQRSLAILTFLHSFEAGGVERDAFRFAQAARMRGTTVHVLVGSAIGPQFEEFGRVPHEILIPRPFGGRFVSTIQLVARLPRRIRTINPDVLYCAGNTYTFITVMLKILLGRRCPPIVVKISNDLERNDQTALFRYFYHIWVRFQMRFFDVVLAMAAPAVDEIRRISAMPPESIRMIENPSLTAEAIEALAAANSRRRPAAGKRYVSIGRLAPQKNFANLLKAFKLVAADADRLVIVGDGEQRAELLALACDLGIAGQLEMPGHRNPVYRFLEDADVFVLPSDYEGLGVVVIEALAAGLPVAATNCCVNMQELLGHGAFGTIAPIRNPQALAAAMARAAAMGFDPARAQMQARRFSVDQTIDRLIGVFNDAVRYSKR